MTQPLRKLLHKDVEWHWNADMERAVGGIKAALTSIPVLSYYDVNQSVKLSVDSSSTAMGVCLMQADKPVAYATRALTPAQQNYPQMVKEAMAIRFGCTKFHEYVYGKELLVESDHKPLETIFKKPLTNAPMRLQKILWDVIQYSPRVVYVKGTQIPIADTLSRDSERNEVEKEETYSINALLSITDWAYRRFKNATERDPELAQLRDVLLKECPENEWLAEKMKRYATFRDELTFENGLLFKANRVIVPSSERERVLRDLHIGHPGITNMSSRARQGSFWIGQSADIKNHVERCTICQAHRKHLNQTVDHSILRSNSKTLHHFGTSNTECRHHTSQDQMVLQSEMSKLLKIC